MSQNSEAPAMIETAVADVSSMLLPMADRQLLIPGVSVAEVVNYSYPERNDNNAPAWFLGMINWRKQSVPLLCFELLNGQAAPRPSTTQRIAVLNNTGFSKDLPFVAIVIQGLPRLVRVTPKDISEDTGLDAAPAELLAVNLSGDTVFIPNITALERAYCDYRKQA